MLPLPLFFSKLFETDTIAEPNRSLPILYPDIIDHIFSIINGWHSPEGGTTLLTCALVSREWCAIARKYSFGTIRGIATYELHRLRKLLPAKHSTLSKHVRTAGFRFYLDSDEWSDVKKVMDLTRNSWTNSRTHAALRQGSLFAWHLWDITSSISVLTHLELSHIKLLITKDELRQILRSLPHLRTLSLNSVGWWIEESSLHYATMGSSGRNTDKRRLVGPKTCSDNDHPFTLDRLYLYLETSDEEDNPFTERLWPHLLFKNLIVNTLIMRVDSGARAFEWAVATEMVQSVAPNLVELDLAREPVDYNCNFLKMICILSFPKLLTLKVVIGAVDVGRDFGVTRNAYKLFLKGLSQLTMPALEQVLIFASEELVYISAVGCVSTYDTDDNVENPIASLYDWDAIDETIQTISLSTPPTRRDQSESINPKFIIALEPCFLDYDESDVDSLCAYVRARCPRTAESGIRIDFRVMSVEVDTIHFD